MAKFKSIYSILILLLVGCGLHSKNEKPLVATNPKDDNSANLSPSSSDVVYSDGWNEIIIRANYAKTTIDTSAHFKTDRNACGRDAYGVLSLSDWNNVASGTNKAVATRPARSWHCVPTPQDNRKYMDGTVEVSIEGKKRTLYQIMDGLICSAIEDHTISDSLLSALNNVVLAADKEECPGGWGT